MKMRKTKPTIYELDNSSRIFYILFYDFMTYDHYCYYVI